ncbi:formylglycine-generating enzyme family protein [Floridanema evergladense]|uniref:Formylglycine-generating enzyme family protein n=1 Tax=Floridaenema evergladense BLCC-F167 TaxID=3153639 RepID=A0ABV4WGM0_9CYAN
MGKLTIKRQTQKFQGYREYIDGIPLEMVLIPEGTFTMGAPEQEEGSNDSERPQHNVTLSSFLMGRYPITQAQWKAIASRTDLKVNQVLDPDPSRFKESYQGIDRWQRPVEQVSWYDAVEFCQRLSKLTGRNYTLPSEAQWEYACRGVTEPLKTGESYPPFHFGETITTDLANFDGRESFGKGLKGECREQTTPVGYFKVVNSFGLSDMHGNVWEWCLDDWHDNYRNAPTDGSAWIDSNEQKNVNRENKPNYTKNTDNQSYSPLGGGSWYDYPNICRSAFRFDYYWRDDRSIYNGFRVVCESGRTL